MSLPMSAWLQDRLAATHMVGGGYQRNMGSPVQSGAAFAMSVLFVAAWAIALMPVLVWNGVRAAVPRH